MAQDAYLIRRGKQFYLRLPVPSPIRHLFPSGSGKARSYIVEPIGRNYDPAKLERDRRVADYRALFARAALMTRKAIAAELEAIKDRAKGRRATVTLPLLATELLERLRAEREADWKAQHDAMLDDLDEVRQERRRAVYDMYPRANKLADKLAERQGSPLTHAQLNDLADRYLEIVEGRRDHGGARLLQDQGETITQASEAWFAEMQRPDAGVRAQTLDGHKLRVRAFVEKCGDIPLASVTRVMASDFLTAIANDRSNRTVNAYAMSLKCVFKSARNRGRFQGENPFEDQRRKAVGEKREAFTAAEVHKLFAAMPVQITPRKHTPETALPWVMRIAAYSGMRLEEIAQLTVKDVQTRSANGGTVVVFDIHNGDSAHHLKNDSSARAIPMHSELVRAGLLDYGQALPQDGLLFPGLKRRESKGGKIGARLGELFRKRLIALDMKRDGLCFHSLRHTVATRLETASVSQTDAARVLGHAIEGMSYGVYSTGPGLKKLAAVVEEISYQE
jgi:integrase